MKTRHVAQMAETMTLRQIADELGVTYDWVCARLKQEGVSALSEYDMADPRLRVQDMKPVDAVNYLLFCIEGLFELKPEDGSALDALDLSRRQRRILTMLVKSPRKFFSWRQVWMAAWFEDESTHAPSQPSAAVYISKIRKRLPESFGRIETRHGLGYRFIPA